MSRLEETKRYFERLCEFYPDEDSLREKVEYLIQQAEKAQMYEDTLKFCQFQLKNGGNRKHERITVAIDKALEGVT